MKNEVVLKIKSGIVNCVTNRKEALPTDTAKIGEVTSLESDHENLYKLKFHRYDRTPRVNWEFLMDWGYLKKVGDSLYMTRKGQMAYGNKTDPRTWTPEAIGKPLTLQQAVSIVESWSQPNTK